MSEFVRVMLERMERGELSLMRQEPCAETKWTYHLVAQDPESGRYVACVGSVRSGDDFSWGKEIPASDLDLYTTGREVKS